MCRFHFVSEFIFFFLILTQFWLGVDQVQVPIYSKYSLLLLPVVGIEPETSRWFYSEALSNQIPNPQCHVPLLDKNLD